MRRVCLCLGLALALIQAAAAAVHHNPTLLQEYLAYLQQWNKNRSTEEIPVRLEYFKAALELVVVHNADEKQSYKLRLNQFADWSEAEIRSVFTTVEHGEGFAARNSRDSVNARGREKMKQPVEHINWASNDNPLGKSVVSPVRNQGLCGACWAFTAAGTTEGSVAINTGMLVPLSVQQMVDCDNEFDRGCNGGNPLYAYNYVQEHGLVAWDDYPYTASTSKCRAKSFKPVSSITDFTLLSSYDEVALAAQVAKGPVAAGICGTHKTFMYYTHGIFDDRMCCVQQNHAVLLVGYGADSDGNAYWMAKNSWGVGWGEDGYIRLRRRTTKGRSSGQCGIAISTTTAIGGYGGNYTTNIDDSATASQNMFREWVTSHWRGLVIGTSLAVFFLSLLAFLHTVYVREPIRYRAMNSVPTTAVVPTYSAVTELSEAGVPDRRRVILFDRPNQYQRVPVQETTPLQVRTTDSINI